MFHHRVSQVPVRAALVGQSPHLPSSNRRGEATFTTKPAGEGTGLGVAIVRQVVERRGGAVALEATPGGGATFEVLLPAVRPTPEVRVGG